MELEIGSKGAVSQGKRRKYETIYWEWWSGLMEKCRKVSGLDRSFGMVVGFLLSYSSTKVWVWSK